MKKYKIAIKSPEHSEKVQKYLMSLGYSWRSGGTHTRHLDRPCLFADSDGDILYASNMEIFESHTEELLVLPTDTSRILKSVRRLCEKT